MGVGGCNFENQHPKIQSLYMIHTDIYIQIRLQKESHLIFISLLVAEKEAFQLVELSLQGSVVLSHPLQPILNHNHLLSQEMHSLLQPSNTLPNSILVIAAVVFTTHLHLLRSSLQKYHYCYLCPHFPLISIFSLFLSHHTDF